MATITLARMLAQAEQAAYEVNKDARRLSSVQADIPKMHAQPKKEEEPKRTTPQAGRDAMEGEVKASGKLNEVIEQDRQQLLGSEPKISMNSPEVQQGMLISDVIDLAEFTTGNNVLGSLVSLGGGGAAGSGGIASLLSALIV